MNDIMSMMEQDFEDTIASSVEKLDQGGAITVASLARDIRSTEEVIADLEKNLKTAKEKLLKLTDQEMPALMEEMGISSLTLDDGSVVKVTRTYGGSILVENRPKAYEWLREHGYDDIIKNTVMCQFGRGEDDRAKGFAEFAAENGFAPEQKTEIHSQTLRAFVKERIEKGDAFPMELFGAYIGQRAIIKKGK
jgi:hypothetical protein